jgi:DNA-binding phage protein
MSQTKMLTLDEIKRRLADRNLKVVAGNTKLAPDTIYRLVNGAGAPSYDTVKTLSDYLQGITNGQA